MKRTAATAASNSWFKQRYGLLKCALLLACITALAAGFPAAALERGQFGWRRSEAVGFRPLLVIWIRPHDDTPANELGRRKQYYEEIIFGTPQREEAWPERLRRFQPSIVDYYRRMSAGKFEWTRAGFVGPITVSPPKPFGPLSGPPGDGKMDGDEIARLAVTTAATQGHFDFRKFDSDHDGKISENELDLLVIVSGSNTSGHAGGFGPEGVPIPGQRVTYMGRKAIAGEGGAFMGYAHELFHTLGAIDLYGPWHGCLTMNEGLSLMTSTNTAPQTEYSLAIDAWHKLWVGWTEPRVVTVGHPGSAQLAAEHASISDAERKRPILLYDPRRGTSEFFLLEYRTPNPLGYDRNVVTSGLVIWHVAHRPGGPAFMSPVLMRKSERPNCHGEYPMIRAVFVRGAPDFQQGVSKAYTSANGEIALKWMDGKDSGLRVTVAPHKPADPLLSVLWSAPAPAKSREAVR